MKSWRMNSAARYDWTTSDIPEMKSARPAITERRWFGKSIMAVQAALFPHAYICDHILVMNCAFDSPPLMATRLELPNGLSYTFGYERSAPFASNYRELRTLTMPTGARIDYGYRLDDNSSPTNYYHVLANPLTSKTVSANGEVIEKWEFSYDVMASTAHISAIPTRLRMEASQATSLRQSPISWAFSRIPDSLPRL